MYLRSPEVIVENGGDVFLKSSGPLDLGLYAGENSPFSGEIKLRIDPSGAGIGICTSSGTVCHSLSMGKADAVTAVAREMCGFIWALMTLQAA